jgi:hypothetical protein
VLTGPELRISAGIGKRVVAYCEGPPGTVSVDQYLKLLAVAYESGVLSCISDIHCVSFLFLLLKSAPVYFFPAVV